MSEEAAGNAGPANSGQEGVQATLFTQDQVNHFVAQGKRGATTGYFKELGFDEPPSPAELKASLEAAAEYRKLQEGQKSDLDRLNGELAATRETAAEVPTLKTQLLRQRLAGDASLPTRFWKFVEGSTDDEIAESIKGLKQELNLAGTDEGTGEGAPVEQPRQGLTPNPQQGSGGGKPPKKGSMSAGMDAYHAKHKKEQTA